MMEWVARDIRDITEYTKEQHCEWNHAVLVVTGMVLDRKANLTERKQALYAQRAGYLEFCEKLRNNQQLELSLEDEEE